MTEPAPNPNHPSPPEDLTGEALLEWYRVVAELDSLGILHKSDRAIITTYVHTWSAFQFLAKQTAASGCMKLWESGVFGQTTFFKEQKIVTKLLCQLLAQLGLTPASRGIKVAPQEQKQADSLEY